MQVQVTMSLPHLIRGNKLGKGARVKLTRREVSYEHSLDPKVSHIMDSPRHRFRFRRRTQPGTRPGTIDVDPAAPRPTIGVIRFGPDAIDNREDISVEELPELLGDFPVTWVDISGLGDAEIVKAVGEVFGLHRLAMEDVVHVHQRPKLDIYDGHMFVVAKMADGTDRFATEQLSLFIGKEFVLSWQEHSGDCFDLVRDRIRSSKSPLRNSSADYLAYAILDAVIDAYFPVLEEYGQQIDELEDEVERSIHPETMQRIHQLRTDVRATQRTAWPHRDLMRRLMDNESDLISERTRVHLRDVYDHTLQILELLESYRDLCSDLRDYYYSMVSNRMNEVMKVLTIIATIFIPLSFIAGLYGMNFDAQSSPWNMPELRWYFGYPAALALMAASAGGMILHFWRRGWIGRSRGSGR